LPHSSRCFQKKLKANGNLCIQMNINDSNKGGSNAGPVGPIVLNTLVLTAYDQSGTAVVSARLADALKLREATLNGNGTGKSDFTFALNSDAAAALAAAIAANPNLRLQACQTLVVAMRASSSVRVAAIQVERCLNQPRCCCSELVWLGRLARFADDATQRNRNKSYSPPLSKGLSRMQTCSGFSVTKIFLENL